MDPAVDILDRALKGDAGALSFLERTASIYVFDGTNPGSPKTLGAWDFLNQALTEVERYEDRRRAFLCNNDNNDASLMVNLENHVQLLATMSRRAARRCNSSDRKLIQICLNNASQYHGSLDVAKNLMDANGQMRERVMGRIAAMTFDFSYHPKVSASSNNDTSRGSSSSLLYKSAFSNPVAMESLCAIVAANSISSGPDEFIHLVSDWIVPSIDHMPPFSVAAVAFHLASEAMGKSAPAGTKDALKNKLFGMVVGKVLAPLLMEAVRESDTGGRGTNTFIATNGKAVSGNGNNNHRIAAMATKALERWSAAAESSLVRVQQYCKASNINIIEVISDALYSDSEIVLDALTELLETLLSRHNHDVNVQEGLALTGSFLGRNTAGGAATVSSQLHDAQHFMLGDEKERNEILSELISAVGLQRFRFVGEQSTGVCRCLASIAASISIASQSVLRSGKVDGSTANGMLELLMKAAAHPSIHVCGIALEAFPPFVTPSSDMALRLLPILQGRAIVPPSLVGMSNFDSCDVDFHEFEKFREHLLGDILVACYTSSRSYYIESCTSAVEEFCTSPPTPQLPYQLEAALFCLSAVSVDASKRALLVNATPAAQAAAAKACASRISGKGILENIDITEDAKRHDEQLSRCTHALAKNMAIASSNPLSLAQMCRFVGKYANWLSKSPSEGVLDVAATLALESFNQATSVFSDAAAAADIIEDMSMSPFAEAATALRNVLSRSPQRFATPDALSALENGWKSAYVETTSKIKIDDRVALCSGICRVLAVLPSEQWSSSLTALAQPTAECIESAVKNAEIQNLGLAIRRNSLGSMQLISRISEEILVLSTMIRRFNNATSNNCQVSQEGTGHPLLAVLHRVWACLSLVAAKYSDDESISSALSEFLLASVSIQDDTNGTKILKDLCEMAATIMGKVIQNQKTSSLVPILDFVAGVIDVHGHIADTDASSNSVSDISTSERNKETRKIIEHLIYLSNEAVQTSLAQKSEQGRGQKPFESSPKKEGTEERKSPDALSGMFSILTSCIERCPVLLVQLPLRAGNLEDEGIFSLSVDSALAAVSEKQVDVARSSILYLKAIIQLSSLANKKDEMAIKSGYAEVRHRLIAGPIDKAVESIRGRLIFNLICGACGIFPREVLDPAASLLHAVLQCTPSEEAGRSTIEAVQRESFILGDEARGATVLTLGKCAQGVAPVSLLMDLFGDLWQMHQTDDAGGTIAGGDAVVQFAQKYKP